MSKSTKRIFRCSPKDSGLGLRATNTRRSQELNRKWAECWLLNMGPPVLATPKETRQLRLPNIKTGHKLEVIIIITNNVSIQGWILTFKRTFPQKFRLIIIISSTKLWRCPPFQITTQLNSMSKLSRKIRRPGLTKPWWWILLTVKFSTKTKKWGQILIRLIKHRTKCRWLCLLKERWLSNRTRISRPLGSGGYRYKIIRCYKMHMKFRKCYPWLCRINRLSEWQLSAHRWNKKL